MQGSRSNHSIAKQPVVVAMGDGTRRKGIAEGFHPSRTYLRLQELDAGGLIVENYEIDLHEALAVFFVRDLAVNRRHRLAPRPTAGRRAAKEAATRLRVQFVWGEVLEGDSYPSERTRAGFYLYPDDRSQNILKVYITRAAVAKMKRLDEPKSVSP